MLGIMFALHGQNHLTAASSIGVGYNTDEEWPRPMNNPWRADTLIDLWEGQYHQVSHLLSSRYLAAESSAIILCRD